MTMAKGLIRALLIVAATLAIPFIIACALAGAKGVRR